MFSLNRATLIGNVGGDPEVRTMNSGDKVVTLSIATSESWKGRDGERQERTEWHKVVIFNPHVAKVAENHVRKGSKVFVEGQIQTRKWDDRDGVTRYSTEIVLQRFGGQLIVLDGRRSDSGDFPNDNSARSDNGHQPGPAFDTDLDDDVPF